MDQGKWEKRWHPLRQEWIVYAAHRNSRPWNFEIRQETKSYPSYDPDCYLCPGNLRVGGHRNPGYEGVFIFDNDHPVVGSMAPSIDPAHAEHYDGLYKRARAGGQARVVCFDPRHNVTMADMHTDEVAAVFHALREEMRRFIREQQVQSVLIFENKGEMTGVSNPHPHCQIYALDFMYNLIRKEFSALENYSREKQRNIFDDIIGAECQEGSRVVAANSGALAFIPFFARFAYETYVFPRKRHATLATLSDTEIADLAAVFHELVRRYDARFRTPFPYVMAFAQAPVDGGHYPDYHMHLIICPPLRQPGLQKFLAGPETGADTFMADTLPEEKAAELRSIIL